MKTTAIKQNLGVLRENKEDYRESVLKENSYELSPKETSTVCFDISVNVSSENDPLNT